MFQVELARCMLALLDHLVAGDETQEMLDLYNTCKPILEDFVR